jgi:hypothetical protein
MDQLPQNDDPSHPANKALQNSARRVIEPLIPPDAEERVQRAYKQWNQIIREHIRNETALRLTDGDGRNSIQVRVQEGFPIPLARLIDSYNDPVLWRIIVGQPKIGGIIEGLRYLLQDWPAFESWGKLPDRARGTEPHLDRTLEVAEILQQLSLADDVREKIRQIHRDILGIYRFAIGVPCQIELYWMPIAMFSAMLDVRIEDLTVVVLAHELAHGYTHIGRDIDGIQWIDNGFANSDLNVVEGLAQFYTEVVANRISSRSPGALVAYQRLLKLQSGPYKAHLEWVKDDSGDKGEIIRFALISARGRGQVKLDDWSASLTDTRKTLRKSRGRDS